MSGRAVLFYAKFTNYIGGFRPHIVQISMPYLLAQCTPKLHPFESLFIFENVQVIHTSNSSAILTQK